MKLKSPAYLFTLIFCITSVLFLIQGGAENKGTSYSSLPRQCTPNYILPKIGDLPSQFSNPQESNFETSQSPVLSSAQPYTPKTIKATFSPLINQINKKVLIPNIYSQLPKGFNVNQYGRPPPFYIS